MILTDKEWLELIEIKQYMQNILVAEEKEHESVPGLDRFLCRTEVYRLINS